MKNAYAPISPGQSATVDLTKVRRDDSSPPYLRLVRQLIAKGEGKVYVASVIPHGYVGVGTPGAAYIRSWHGDLIGDVRVPLDSLRPS
jgi:hypothetical protein